MRTSTAEQVLRGALQEFSEAPARWRDVPANHLARCGVDEDLERPPSILIGREPDGRVQELGILHVDRCARILDRVNQVLQQLSLVVLDLFARDPIGFVLVHLRVQEPGIADHSSGVKGHLESERQFELPGREVAGPSAQDLPEVIPAQVPCSAFVGTRPGEHAGVARRRVDLEHVEGQIGAFHRGDSRGLTQIVRFHHAAVHPAFNRPYGAVAVDPRRQHRMPQDERLVPLEPRGGAAIGARDDHLARGQGQGPAAFRAVDRFDEIGHTDGMLMGWSNIASFMGSLGALRRGSLFTVVLLFAFLSLLLLLIVAIVDYVFQAHAFPGGFAIVVALAVFFILFEWLISPFIVRWAIRSREPVTPESNPWLYNTVQELTRQAGVPMPW